MKHWDVIYKTEKNTLFSPTDIQNILLENRGFSSQKEKDIFLHPILENLELTKLGVAKVDIDQAKKLVTKNIDDKKTIVIYGDYDVDGVCATAIVWETLYPKYKKTIPYIPSRIEEGYGLSRKGIDNILSLYPDIGLIITVDNGIAAHDAIAYAKEKDIAVIVTDHHTKGETMPLADVIIHSTKVCGAGIAYTFAKAIFDITEDSDKHLELVALATVADCMPLIDENRVAVTFGLKALAKTQRPGLLELYTDAKIDKDTLDVYHIGFVISPRINATGRLESAMDSLRLLCTVDLVRAKVLSKKLADSNRTRQEITTESVNHAMQLSDSDALNRIIVVAHDTYNPGIIGLIASKLTEKYHRPSIVIAKGTDGTSKGSARSIKGIHIVDLLRTVAEHLVQVGGHEMAAGFTIETDKIDVFTQLLTEHANVSIRDDQLQKVYKADIELSFQEITFNVYKKILPLAPFGIANPEPLFVTKGVEIREIKSLGKEGKHLKLLLAHDDIFFEALAFGWGESFDKKIGDGIDILYSITLNTWNGKSKVELKIKDLR